MDQVLDPFDDQLTPCGPLDTPPARKPLYSPQSMSLIYGVTPPPSIVDTPTLRKDSSANTPRNPRATSLGISPLAKITKPSANLQSPLVQVNQHTIPTSHPLCTTSHTSQNTIPMDSSAEISSFSSISSKLTTTDQPLNPIHANTDPIVPLNKIPIRKLPTRGKCISITDAPSEKSGRKPPRRRCGSPLKTKKQVRPTKMRHSHTTTSLGRMTDSGSPTLKHKSSYKSAKAKINSGKAGPCESKLLTFNENSEDELDINKHSKYSNNLEKSKSMSQKSKLIKSRHSSCVGITTKYNDKSIRSKSTPTESHADQVNSDNDYIGHPLLDDSFHPHSPSKQSVNRQQSTIKILRRRKTIHGPPRSVLIKPRHLCAISTSESNSSADDAQDNVSILDENYNKIT